MIVREASMSSCGVLVDAYRTLVGPGRAFLPERVPIFAGLVEPFSGFRAAVEELPEHYQQPAPGVRGWLDGLFGRSDPDVEHAAREADAATKAGLFAVLTMLVHTYRWDTAPPAADRFAETDLALPEGIRLPWAALCAEVGLPLVGTAWSFLMCNWTIPGREGDDYDPASLSDDGVRIGCQWLRPPEDANVENFNLAFVCLEAKGGPVTAAAVDAVAAAHEQEVGAVSDALSRLTAGIDDMTGQFVDRIRAARVALDGWLDLVQPTFGWGLPGADGQPLSGPGGMQLATLHVLNSVLGVPAGSPIGKATLASRQYIPAPPREFLSVLDRYAPRLREFVLASGSQDAKRAFNDAVRALKRFRLSHRVQGARYLRAGGQDGAPRLSSGTGISWREDPSLPKLEPAELFERQMSDRIGETTDALAPGAGERSEVRAPETSFRFLDRPQLRALLALAQRKSFPPGSVLIAAGERSEAMYLLIEGAVSVVTPSAASAGPVARLWPGELFGELSFLGAVPSTSVIADTEVVVDVLSGDSVHSLLEADTTLAADFYRSLSALIGRRLGATGMNPPRTQEAGPRGALLVVDDDPFNRAMLTRLLEHEGYEPTAVEDGAAALSALERGSFDAVLLDIVMPGIDGISVLRTIKNDSRHRNTPVVMISSVEEREEIARCIDLGADDYLQKPFDPVVLRARLKASLALKSFQDLETEYQQIADDRDHQGTAGVDPASVMSVRRPVGPVGSSDAVARLNFAERLTDEARAQMAIGSADDAPYRLLVQSVESAPAFVNAYATLAEWARRRQLDPYEVLRRVWTENGSDDQRALRFIQQYQDGDPAAALSRWCVRRGSRPAVIVQVADDLSFFDLYDYDGVPERAPVLVGRIWDPQLICSPRDFGALPAAKRALAEDLIKRGKDFRMVVHRGTVAQLQHRTVFGPAIDTLHFNAVLHQTVYRSSLATRAGRAVEIGTGSGFLLCSLLTGLRHRPLELVASDIDPLALETAGNNVAEALADVTDAAAVNVRLEQDANLLERLPAGSVDLLFSNPPYIPERQYAGDNPWSGTRVIEALLCREGPRVLAPGGAAVVLYSSLTLGPLRAYLERSPLVPVVLAPGRRVPLDLREVGSDPAWVNLLRREHGLEEELHHPSHVHWHTLHMLALCRPENRLLIDELRQLAEETVGEETAGDVR